MFPNENFLNLIQSRETRSSTSLVGTTPEKTQIQQYESIFNNIKTLNVTITFNLAYADMDTLYEGPKSVEKLLQQLNKFHSKDYVGWNGYYFVSEKHANEKRWHMHGQILLRYSQRSEGIKQFKNLYRKLNSIGRSSVKWNNPNYEVKSEEHLTYTQYCFKESKTPTIQQLPDQKHQIGPQF